MSGRRRAALYGIGIVVTLGLVWMARPVGGGLGWRLAFVGLHLGAFGSLAVWLRTTELSRSTLLIGAVLFRLAAIPMAPTLSDDGYRYLWDGLVAAETPYSPYDLRPSDPRLQRLQREPLYARLNSPEYFSVYPPASQAVFRVAAWPYRSLGFTASWILLKLLLVAVELVGIVLLATVASPARVAMYAWSPLAVMEIAGQGHTEALVVAGLGAMVWRGGSRIPVRSIAATLAGAAKLYPLAWLPLAWRREGAIGVFATLAVLVVLAGPVASPDALSHAVSSLGLFYGTLDWFSAPYLGIKAALYPVLGTDSGRVAGLLLGAVFVLVCGLAWVSDDGTTRSARVLMAVLTVAAVASVATLHPWYLLPVLAAVPVVARPRALVLAAGSVSLSYLAYEMNEGARLVLLVAFWAPLIVVSITDWRSANPRRFGGSVQ